MGSRGGGNEVQIVVTAKGDQAVSETTKVRRKLEREGEEGGKGFSRRFSTGLSAGFGPVRGAIRGLGASMLPAFAAIGGAAGLVAGGKAMTDLSRRIANLDTKAKTVFEGQLPRIRRWADENKRAFGLSRRETVGLAADLSDLLKPMGFTAKQAADMSVKTLDLAGALSKWSGGEKSAAEVSDILTKAYLGERDALDSLGISITQDEVNARLAKEGKDKLTGASRQRAEAEATEAMIIEKSTDAQKAWAKGGREAAAAQGSLSTTIAETKEKIATALTPTIKTLTAWLNEKLPAAIAWVQSKLRELHTWWVNNKDAVQALGRILLSTLVPAEDAAGKKADDLKSKTKGLTDALNKILLVVAYGTLAYLRLGQAAIITGKGIINFAIAVLYVVNAVNRLSGGTGHAADSMIADLRRMRDKGEDQLTGLKTQIRDLQRTIDKLHGKQIEITTLFTYIGKPAAGTSPPGTSRRMAGGGILTEPVLGVGTRTGTQYTLGEQGPEAVVPLRGHVRGGGGGVGSAPVVLEIRSGGSRLDDLLVEILRNAVRVRGGNVQVVLGT